MNRLWLYIKQKNLFVPGNESNFLPDKLLEPIFGTKEVPVFGMSRYLARHIF